MRLFEVEDRFVDDLETVLRNQIGRSDAEHTSSVLTWEALSNIMSNLGYGEIGFKEFQRIYIENPSIHSLVQDYSEEDGIVLGTKVEAPPEQQPADSQLDIPQGRSVDQMAHKGAQKLQPDI